MRARKTKLSSINQIGDQFSSESLLESLLDDPEEDELDELMARVRPALPDIEVIPISAVARRGLDRLTTALMNEVEAQEI